MLLSLIYALVRLLLDVLLIRSSTGGARDAELLALRHEVRVLRRRPPRIPWRPSDRLIFVALVLVPAGSGLELYGAALAGCHELFGR